MTYTINVTRGSLPLRIAVAAVGNLLEVASNVVVDASVLAEVKLVTVIVRVLSRGVADFCTAGDHEGALACILQGYSAIDSGCIDLVV